MRRASAFLLSLVLLNVLTLAQDKPATTTPPQRTPATTTTPKPGSTEPEAVIETTAGTMHCTLFPKVAPIGVDNFIGLAKGTKDWTSPSGQKKHGVPLYNGTIFHRVIPDFMIQGGDPKGDGTGDPGFKFKNETSSDVTFDRPGRLAYANAGPDTNGSQFFITEVAYPSLNGGYTIFGQCDDPTVELVKQIARMARDPRNDMPFRPIKIVKITIVKAGIAGGATHPATPAAKKPAPQS